MMRGRLRRCRAAAGAAAIALTLAACGTHTLAKVQVQAKKTTSGRPTDAAPANPASQSKPVSASGIKNLGLSTEDIDQIAGLPLDDRAEFASPTSSAGDYDHPACALAMGLTKDALGDGEFTAYRGIQNKASKGDSLIGLFKQQIATFETATKAGELFHSAYNSLAKCNSTTISAKSDPTTWKILAAGPFNTDVVTFSSLQLTDTQQNLGWRCSHEVRVKNNVIVEALLCAWADAGPATAAAVDQISARIPPLDKPAAKAPPDFLAPDEVTTVMLSLPQVDRILGFNLGVSESFFYPPDPHDFGDKSYCSPLLGPDATTFGVDVEYTAYREADYREDKDNYQHIVNQKVATYPDAQSASRTFQIAFSKLAGCDGARVPAGSATNEQFLLPTPTVDGNTARWVLIDVINGQPNTWRCAVNVRTQSNVLFAAKVCQYGDPDDTVAQIADQMADSIPK
jgi:hypothetical protein